MRTLYDVQQLLKQYGIFIHFGNRLYDIELMSIELRHIYDAGLLDIKDYQKAKSILIKEHHLEKQNKWNHKSLEERFNVR